MLFEEYFIKLRTKGAHHFCDAKQLWLFCSHPRLAAIVTLCKVAIAAIVGIRSGQAAPPGLLHHLAPDSILLK